MPKAGICLLLLALVLCAEASGHNDAPVRKGTNLACHLMSHSLQKYNMLGNCSRTNLCDFCISSPIQGVLNDCHLHRNIKTSLAYRIPWRLHAQVLLFEATMCVGAF